MGLILEVMMKFEKVVEEAFLYKFGDPNFFKKVRLRVLFDAANVWYKVPTSPFEVLFNPRAADRCRSVDQSAPGRPRNFNFISLWQAAEAQSIAPSQAGHGKIIKHLPVRGDKKVGQHWFRS
ncbi:hypothetical protein NDU88_005616 [Pleurodeles waltl]|uniref:Uncharacterized protein n=1 Tax=Pleurodeles waltl TaxID=8319 RepID=A0AAV7ULK9_PLEWA|nr:hypothetical protein NDU88_005616 [Pleurodeles waltl]